MPNASDPPDALEARIDEWRSYVRRRQSIRPVDVEELEDHLRDQVAALVRGGLTSDEAFLVAVKRMGTLDALSHEFAREHSERLWKQLVLTSSPTEDGRRGREDTIVAFALAVAAGVAIKVPELFGLELMGGGESFYARNMSLFVLPLLAGYFAWKRGLSPRIRLRLAGAFALAAVFANTYPFEPLGSTEVLTILHLPIALWLPVGVAYAGGRWNEAGRRMDFVRFSGELFIYYVLIALGGGVLAAFMGGMFQAIGVDVEWLLVSWILPCGAMGAILIGSWLVEAKQSVIENMAPVLTRVFTPLFALTLLAFLGTMAWTGRGIDIERDVLIAFDLLLVVVLGLLLYSVSARDPDAPPDVFDGVTVLLVVSALIADAHLGVRVQSEPNGGPRREPHPAREPGLVGQALRGVLARPGVVRRA